MRVHAGSRCPRPGCNGRVYQTGSATYGPFLGCTNYPASCYAAWDQRGRRLPRGALSRPAHGSAATAWHYQPTPPRGGHVQPQREWFWPAVGILLGALLVAAAVAQVVHLLT